MSRNNESVPAGNSNSMSDHDTHYLSEATNTSTAELASILRGDSSTDQHEVYCIPQHLLASLGRTRSVRSVQVDIYGEEGIRGVSRTQEMNDVAGKVSALNSAPEYYAYQTNSGFPFEYSVAQDDCSIYGYDELKASIIAENDRLNSQVDELFDFDDGSLFGEGGDIIGDLLIASAQ